MATLRGEPQIDEVLEVLTKVWTKVPDMRFARVFGNACASLGFVGYFLGDAVFMDRISDSDFIWGLHYWMYMSRGELTGNCPVCDKWFGDHEMPIRGA